MTPKEKAISIIEMHKLLSVDGARSYAITYCDSILNNNPTLTSEKQQFWQEVKKEIEKL